MNVVSESDSSVGGPTYGSAYTYDAAGDRSTVVYSKNSAETARYGYTDYAPAGDPSNPSRISRRW